MDESSFLSGFELRFRQLLPSLDEYRMRPANNALWVSFTDERDFLATVRSASGANIALEIGWRFGVSRDSGPSIAACYLRFDLSNDCRDERLSVFLEDLAGQRGDERPR